MKKLTHNILPLFLLSCILILNACKKTDNTKAIVHKVTLPEYVIPGSVDNQMYTYVAPIEQEEFKQAFIDAGLPFDVSKIVNSGFGDLFIKVYNPDGSDSDFKDFDFGYIFFRKDGATSAAQDVKVGEFSGKPGGSECTMSATDAGNLKDFITSGDKFYMVISMHRSGSNGIDKKMAAKATIKLDVSLD